MSTFSVKTGGARTPDINSGILLRAWWDPGACLNQGLKLNHAVCEPGSLVHVQIPAATLAKCLGQVS